MNETATDNYNSVINQTAGFDNSTALQIRLDTSQLVKSIEMYLRGLEEVLREDKDGNPIIIFEAVGEPKLNKVGIHSFMNKISGILNPHVAQGNFKEEPYGKYLCRVRRGIAIELSINLHRYGVKITDYNAIINSMMNIVEPFTSRLLFNKERESYNNTIRSVESNTQTMKGGGLHLPFNMK